MDTSLTYPNVPIWITGDLNLSNINWENCAIQGTAYPASLCDTIINFYMSAASHMWLILQPKRTMFWISSSLTDPP